MWALLCVPFLLWYCFFTLSLLEYKTWEKAPMEQAWSELPATALEVVTEELCHTLSLVLGVFVSSVHKQHHGETMGIESSCGHSMYPGKAARRCS